MFGAMPAGIAMGVPNMMDQGKPKRSGLFGDPRRIAGVLGDVAAGLAGQQGPYAPMMHQRAAQQEAMRYQQEQVQQARQWANEDWQTRQDYDRDNPDPATPGSFEWYQAATPEQRAQYDEYNPVTVATGAGPIRVPRNRPALGTTERDPNAEAPSMQNTPAPQLGANGLPSELTRQQYQALVSESGGNASAVNDYLARMGIQVRN